MITTARPKPDSATVAAVDVARAALVAGGRRRRRRRPPRPRRRGRARRHPPVRLRAARATSAGSWSVTVARAPRQKTVTVDEIVLIPGDEAIVAPPWVPYRERIKPGDLSPGDLLPVDDDDPRLVPTYFAGDDPLDPDEKAQIRTVAQDLGLGRVRTLVAGGPRARRAAVVRRRRRPGGPDRPLGAGQLHDLRLPDPHRRPAVGDVRRLRQRRRQRRRPGRVVRPRLRRALRGPAGQEARAAADAGAGLRHADRRRDRDGSEPQPSSSRGRRPRSARALRWRRQYSSPIRPRPNAGQAGPQPPRRCRPPRAGRRTAAARGTRPATARPDLDGAYAVDVERLDIGDEEGAVAELVLQRLAVVVAPRGSR